jgi:anti-sigma-K factor RskA
MGFHLEREAELRRYLLGVLTAEEKAQVEEQLFLDKEFFQRFQAAEDDLIDEYVSGGLSAEEQEQFESGPLSGFEYKSDLRIAKALQKYVAEEAEPEPLATGDESSAAVLAPTPRPTPVIPRWRHALFPRLALAVAVVIVVVGLWLLTRDARRSEPPEADQARAPQTPERDVGGKAGSNLNGSVETSNGNSGTAADPGGNQPSQNQVTPTPERVPAPADPNRQPNRPPAPSPKREPSGRTFTATILFPVGQVRGDGEAGNRIIIPGNADYVTLRLLVLTRADYSTYEATLAPEDGVPIKVWSRLKPTGAKLFRLPSVPAGLLSSQSYRLELKGGDRQGNFKILYTYHLQIARR